MGKRFNADRATARTAPNGAVSLDGYGGALAQIENCPVAGHARRLTVYATDRAGNACTRIRGQYVRGTLGPGPVFRPLPLPGVV